MNILRVNALKRPKKPDQLGKMDVYEFGRKLLETNDLDPVYVILYHARLAPHKLCRWLLAYWCFYHVGTASWITHCEDYWVAMETAAGSKEFPRSRERRHFRGRQAKSSVSWLKARGVELLFRPIIGRDLTIDALVQYVGTWRGFGPWISFKVADMLERLGLCRVRFTNDAMFMFDSPRQGAYLTWDLYGAGNVSDPYTWGVNSVLNRLKHLDAPPGYERKVNVQEVETVLCKWKSYMYGHYHLGEDIEATRHGLLRFARCRLCQRLLAAGKKGGLW